MGVRFWIEHKIIVFQNLLTTAPYHYQQNIKAVLFGARYTTIGKLAT